MKDTKGYWRDISKSNSSFITSGDDITMLDVKKLREYTHNNRRGAIPGKSIINEDGVFDTQTRLEGLDKLLDRVYARPRDRGYKMPQLDTVKMRVGDKLDVILNKKPPQEYQPAEEVLDQLPALAADTSNFITDAELTTANTQKTWHTIQEDRVGKKNTNEYTVQGINRW